MKNVIKENKLTLIRLLLAAILLVAAMLVDKYSHTASLILYLASYALGACLVIFRAIACVVKDGKINEKMLIAVATVCALLLGRYFDGAMVVILFELTGLIEDFAIAYSYRHINRLSSHLPTEARTRSKGLMVDAQKIRVGDVVEVLAGEVVPVDGIVINGVGTVDTSYITGENSPKEVRGGSTVLAGDVNLNSVLHIKAIRNYNRSVAQRMIALSTSALEKKTRLEKFIRKFANLYTPIVIVLSVAVAVVPPLFDGFNFSTWIYRALALLAISCPAALVISVPLAYFCSISYASKKGILIKNATVIEELDKIRTMAFDKAGTLTKAELHVTKVEAAQGYTKLDVLRFIYIAEGKSAHPIAQAVQYEAKKLNLPIEQGTNYKEYASRGVECDSMYGHIMAGIPSFVDVPIDVGTGAVLVTVEGKYIGYVGVGDDLKENSKIAFDRLRKLGVKNRIILSEDKKSKVDMALKSLGADGAYSQLLPEDRAGALKDIATTYPDSKIAYCGSGIGDIVPLSKADLGIAMGGAVGSDTAVERSDVIIVNDDISKIPKAVKIAKKAKHNLMANISFVALAKIGLTVLSVIGIIPLFAAAAADLGILVLSVMIAMHAGR